MGITNNCTNQNINVYYKVNSKLHNQVKQNDEILSHGILIKKLNYIKFDNYLNEFTRYINSKNLKTLIVKSHLNNIGYFDINIDFNCQIININKSSKFNNHKKDNGEIYLTINHLVSIQKDLFVKGDVTAFSIFVPSDKELKQNINEITDGLSIINKLRPVKFKWKKNNNKSIGFIAQEVENVLPNLVKTSPENTKIIKQDKLIVYIVDSIKNINNRLKKYESIKSI